MRPTIALGLAVSCLVALPDGGLAQDARLAQRHLSLHLSIRYQTRTIEGSAQLTVENAGQEPVARAPLLLGRLMAVDAVEDSEGPLAFSTEVVRFDDWLEFQVVQLWVELREPLPPGETVALRVHYGGTLVGYTETGMQYVRDHVSPDFTLIRSDALAFPLLGSASLAAMRSQPTDDFTFDVRITVPRDDVVVAAAVPGERATAPDGGTTWSFASEEAAPFLLVAIAPYDVIEGSGITIFHFEEDRAGALRLLDAATAAMTKYAEWFGVHHEDRQVTIMEIPEGWGSQASLTGGIIQTADAFRDGDALPALYHEIAHLWHPRDLERPSDRWNEGFATFLQWRLAAERDPAVKLDVEMARIADAIVRVNDRASTATPITLYGEEGRTDLAYRNGALMFYLLYKVLGEASFDRCMEAYMSQYAGSGSTNSDFVSAVSQCSPNTAQRVLDEWFFSTRGLERLQNSESLDDLAASYLASVPVSHAVTGGPPGRVE